MIPKRNCSNCLWAAKKAGKAPDLEGKYVHTVTYECMNKLNYMKKYTYPCPFWVKDFKESDNNG